MNYKTGFLLLLLFLFFTGTKGKVKGLSQRNAAIVVTDTPSPCRILTGLTHVKFPNTEVFGVFAF